MVGKRPVSLWNTKSAESFAVEFLKESKGLINKTKNKTQNSLLSHEGTPLWAFRLL